MEFAIHTEISAEHGFETVEQTLRDLLQDQGFGILTEIDVKAVMKKKLDLDKEPYKILGACNPPRANKVLTADPELGIFLPCNVIIYQRDETIHVSATDALSVFKMINNPEIESVAKEVTDIFTDVIDQLSKKFA